jgi:TM2 domain-containing membrane protein YozV
MSSYTAGNEGNVPPLPPPGPAPAYQRPPKSPGLALALSLFPGLGQVYNGQPSKAFLFFFGWVGSIYGAVEIHPLPFAFLIPFVYFYNLVDAWRSASLINSRGAGEVVQEDTAESPAWGGGLILLGLVLLLNNLGWLRLASLQRYWPVLLIIAGAVFLYGSLQRRRPEATADPNALQD